jgi:hypothetical protein
MPAMKEYVGSIINEKLAQFSREHLPDAGIPANLV